jgi:hypothetical protein
MPRAPGTLRQLLKSFAANFSCGYSSMKEVSIPWPSSRYSETSLDLVTTDLHDIHALERVDDILGVLQVENFVLVWPKSCFLRGSSRSLEFI